MILNSCNFFYQTRKKGSEATVGAKSIAGAVTKK
jgi:hypothetical protein